MGLSSVVHCDREWHQPDLDFDTWMFVSSDSEWSLGSPTVITEISMDDRNSPKQRHVLNLHCVW